MAAVALAAIVTAITIETDNFTRMTRLSTLLLSNHLVSPPLSHHRRCCQHFSPCHNPTQTAAAIVTANAATSDNFPRMTRLSTLLLSNNLVARIGADVGTKLPNLTTLILTNNRINILSEVDALAACTKLTMLSLLDNPVARQQHYRLYLIHRLPRWVLALHLCSTFEVLGVHVLR